MRPCGQRGVKSLPTPHLSASISQTEGRVRQLSKQACVPGHSPRTAQWLFTRLPSPSGHTGRAFPCVSLGLCPRAPPAPLNAHVTDKECPCSGLWAGVSRRWPQKC